MDKLELIIKELQLHVNNEELSDVIVDKLWDAYRLGDKEAGDSFAPLYNRVEKTLQKISSEERRKIFDGHRWYSQSDDGEDGVCSLCGVYWSDQHRLPTYCEKGEL